MKITQIIFNATAFILLAGCSVNLPTPVPQRTPPDQTQPISPGPTATVYASQTSQTETVMPAVTASLPAADGSPTPLESQFTIRHHCPDEKVGIGGLPELPGTLVFSAENSLAGKDILAPEAGTRPAVSFWQPQSGRISTYPLEDEESGYYYYVESPDKEKLAVTQGKTQAITYDLAVVDRQGKELGRVPVPDDWTFFY